MNNIYTVEINHQGKTHIIEVAEDRKILDVIQETGLNLPTSCGVGVCITCAVKLLEGTVEQGEGMGISSELQREGYALLCVSYPRSDLKIETEKEDEVYTSQFPQF